MSRRASHSSLGASENDARIEFENFKKKFLLANKHITKLNSTLSVRIEELNAQISRLYVENLRLRASEIVLTAQLKNEREKSFHMPAQTSSPSITSLNRKTSDIPKKDYLKWAKLSNLGVLHEEDFTDNLVSVGGRSSDSEGNVADSLEAMDAPSDYDSTHDLPVVKRVDVISLPESAESSFFASLSSVTTEDLTGFIIRDSEYPAHGGGYADVYTGTLSKEEKKTKVAIKVIRAHTYTPSNQWKIEKRLRREIRLWSCLHHPNVVPLLGTTLSFGSHTSMVCPWMNEGNLHHYLSHRKVELNLRRRLQILADVVEGLLYLHSQPVIHGDLTTGNILMDGGKAHLSDFGLSNVMPEVRNNTFLSSTVGGTPRWTAPELFHVGTDINTVPTVTKQCDIYSLGSAALQIISGRIPYDDIMSDVQVIMQLINGNDPPRPAEPLLSDAFWDFIVLCWSRNPSARPEIDLVREKLEVLRYNCSEEILAANVVNFDELPEEDTVHDSE